MAASDNWNLPHCSVCNKRLSCYKATFCRKHFPRKKGITPWNKGMKGFMAGEENPSWKGGKPNCLDCGRKLCYPYKGESKKGKTRRCHKCSYKLRSQENAPNWKGGIAGLYKHVRENIKYIDWRKSVYERDDYTCQLCGQKGGKIECDHHPIPFFLLFHIHNIKTVEDALNCVDFWDMDNARTLCIECHRQTPTWGYRALKLLDKV